MFREDCFRFNALDVAGTPGGRKTPIGNWAMSNELGSINA
jgi:hypothetical protein